MAEIWKKIKDFPNYEISSYGRLKNLTTNYILTDRYKKSGYAIASLYIGSKKSYNKYIHRLVAEAFIPNPNNYPTVNHIDFDKKNNRIENLEWATQSQQSLHNNKKTNKKTITNNMRKVWKICPETDKKLELYNSCKEAANQTGFDHSGIIKVCKGKKKTCGGYKWKYDQDFDDKIEGEIWKYSDKYNINISNKGRIKLQNGKISYGNDTSEGYLNFYSNFIHRLVALTFIENPNNYPTVNHIDGNKKNNTVDNLEWATHSHQQNHIIEKNLKPSQGKRRTCPVIHLNTNKTYDSIKEAAKATGCNQAHISQVCQGNEAHIKQQVFKYKN